MSATVNSEADRLADTSRFAGPNAREVCLPDGQVLRVDPSLWESCMARATREGPGPYSGVALAYYQEAIGLDVSVDFQIQLADVGVSW
jgi:hypothetical protein